MATKQMTADCILFLQAIQKFETSNEKLEWTST